jgi:hypothetical protein
MLDVQYHFVAALPRQSLRKITGGLVNRVVHFELGAIDPARAVEFY